ncbi:MAG: hypothetical protein WC595_06175 [Candidatus Nanoarchaeia archaeon]
MAIEDFLLTKDELPVLYKPRFTRPIFHVPIHPALIRSDIRLDPQIARRVFPQAAKEWYAELREYADRLNEEDTDKEWFNEVFLKAEPAIEKVYAGTELERQETKPLSWRDDVRVEATGFASAISISRDAGGSLLYNGEKPGLIHPRFTRFSEEKFKVYCADPSFNERGTSFSRGTLAFEYAHHNIDHYPGALFLRNWAILILNESMKELGEEVLRKGKED